MKIYNVSSGYKGCVYVRQLISQIANGWDGDFKSYLELDNRKLDPVKRKKACDEADILCFHRVDDPKQLELMRYYKSIGKKIVYDNDDTAKISDTAFLASSFRYEENIYEAIKIADLVTTSTMYLGQEYKQLNPNTWVLPNYVCPSHWPLKPKRNEGKKVRIGFIGSVAYTADVGNIKETVKWLCSQKDVQVIMYSFSKDTKQKLVGSVQSDELKFWEDLPIEWQEWTQMNKYFETLDNLKLDIMVAPRGDTYFNRCKSYIKWLEASMLEIPFIGQSFPDGNSPYDKVLNGKNGLLAGNEQEWKEQLTKLIKNKELRREIGKEAKIDVLANYNIFNNAYKWEKIYKTIL